MCCLLKPGMAREMCWACGKVTTDSSLASAAVTKCVKYSCKFEELKYSEANRVWVQLRAKCNQQLYTNTLINT